MALSEFQRRAAKIYEAPPTTPDPFGRAAVTPKQIKELLTNPSFPNQEVVYRNQHRNPRRR